MKAELPEQHITAQVGSYPHINRMGFIEDVQIEEGMLVENIAIRTGLGQPVFYKPDPFILEVDTGKAFFPAALYGLLLADINTPDEIVALKQGTKEKDPYNDKKNADGIFGKCQ